MRLSVFPLMHHHAYLTQENVKMTRHFHLSCVPGTHEKSIGTWSREMETRLETRRRHALPMVQCALKCFSFTWHVGEHPMFIVFGGHCHWYSLSFVSLIIVQKRTVSEVLMWREGVDKRPKITESNRQDHQVQETEQYACFVVATLPFFKETNFLDS